MSNSNKITATLTADVHAPAQIELELGIREVGSLANRIVWDTACAGRIVWDTACAGRIVWDTACAGRIVWDTACDGTVKAVA